MSDRVIYKYALTFGTNRVSMPFNAKLLTVQVQAGRFQLWALVDRANRQQERLIVIYGTGHPLPDKVGDYIATVQEGPYVWHVFDLTSIA